MSDQKDRQEQSGDGPEVRCKCGHPIGWHTDPWCCECGCDDPEAIGT